MGNSYKIRSLIDRMRQVSDVLVKHDPEGLIKLGAPSDEYESEAVDIANALTSNIPATPERCTAICKDIWIASFSAVRSDFDKKLAHRVNEKMNWEPIAAEISEIFKREKPE